MTDRISKPSMFMGFAEVTARRSTCYRRSIGAVLVVDSNVCSIGYNGPPSGEPHCSGPSCTLDGICRRSIHAERNALTRVSAGVTWTASNSQLYTTESPCPDCARLIIEKNVGTVFYLNEYRMPEGLKILVEAGVAVYRLTPSGYVVDYATGKLTNP